MLALMLENGLRGSEWLRMRRVKRGHTTRHEDGQGEVSRLDSQSRRRGVKAAQKSRGGSNSSSKSS